MELSFRVDNALLSMEPPDCPGVGLEHAARMSAIRNHACFFLMNEPMVLFPELSRKGFAFVDGFKEIDFKILSKLDILEDDAMKICTPQK